MTLKAQKLGNYEEVGAEDERAPARLHAGKEKKRSQCLLNMCGRTTTHSYDRRLE